MCAGCKLILNEDSQTVMNVFHGLQDLGLVEEPDLVEAGDIDEKFIARYRKLNDKIAKRTHQGSE